MTADLHDLTYAGIRELADAYRARRLSPVDVVQAQLERIRRLDGTLCAYIAVTAERALEQARQAERELRGGNDRGILHGIPFAVKDQIATQGIRTTSGSLILKDWIPAADATVVARLQAAGAILLGKLNMPPFALGEPRRYPFGTPRNPWNPDHETGGSSAGSGSALAAGMVTTSIGEDTGGSIRQPAAHCGVAGLRPTWGLVSRHGLVPGVWQLDTMGPMARTVEDAAHVLNAIAGRDPLDPTTVDPPVRDFVPGLDAGLRGLRAAVVQELLPGPGLDPEVGDAVHAAARTLERLGLTVGEVSIPLARASWVVYGAFADPSAALTHAPYLVGWTDRLDPNLRVRLAAGYLIPGSVARWAERVARPAITRQVLEAFETFDILLTPTTHAVAPRIVSGEAPARPSKDDIVRTQVEDRSYRATFALAGVPALAVCCGFSRAGLPISLQIVGKPQRDDLVLRIGHAYQQVTDWHTRRPRIVSG